MTAPRGNTVKSIQVLLTVPSTDPDDARRRKLLNILLAAVGVLSLVTLLTSLLLSAIGLVNLFETVWLIAATLIMLLSAGIVFILNRFAPGWLASSVFLLVLTVVFAFADEPRQIVEGRSLFLFTIPILVSSVLLRSWASFAAAAINSILISIIALRLGIVPPVPSLIGLFLVALISWLAAHSLEQALKDLRDTNRELDERVSQRTQDLADALARQHAVASHNQAILESIADGVIVFDNEGKAVEANPAITRLLERPADQIIGEDVNWLMEDSMEQADRDKVLDTLVDRESRHANIKLNWGKKTLSASFAPVRGRLGDVIGTVSVFRDFTREAELDRMKNDFISISSHELRTPLTSIRGYLDLVLMGVSGSINPEQRKFLQIVEENTKRLHHLANDLLDISRIESGQIELDSGVVSLSEMVDEVATLFKNQFEEKGLKLVVDVPDDLPEILADPVRVTQVLRNLVSNALKYTRSGSVTIRVHVVAGSIQIDVEDTGIGMSDADLKKLFTRFFRAEDPLVREQGGTGLGLNITRSLVEMHGGKIWVQSKVGVGSTFSVKLPLPGSRSTSPSTSAAGSGSQTKPGSTRGEAPHILVADNEPNIAHLFKTELEMQGYHVDVVTKGSDVLSAVNTLKPDVITLDLLMDVDGLSVLKQLKDNPATPNIPAIIISVLSRRGDTLTLGAADYLVKPLDAGELTHAIELVLGPSDDSEPARLLVVDDDPDIRRWLEVALTHDGYEVATARNGAEALEMLSESKPDLILLDLMMPVMDGRQMLEIMRGQEETRDLPVIVLTAVPFESEQERQQILTAGVTKLLHKPVSARQLAEEIAKVVESDPAGDH